MKDLIDDVFVAAFDNAALAPLEDQARFDLADLARARRPARLHHRLLRGRSAVLPRRRYRQARGLRHGQRSRGRRRDAALSLLRGDRRRRRDHRSAAADRRLDGERRPRTRASRSSPATPRSCTRGACDKLFLTTTGIGVIREGVDLGAHRARAGDVVLVNGLLGDHGAAILCARGDMALEYADRKRLRAAARARSRRCWPPRPAFASCATRRAAAWRPCSTRSPRPRRSRSKSTRRRRQSARRSRPSARSSASIRSISPTKARSSSSRRRTRPRPRSRRCARIRSARAPAIVGRVHAGEAGRVTMRTVFGGRRIVDMLVGEQLPRIC